MAGNLANQAQVSSAPIDGDFVMVYNSRDHITNAVAREAAQFVNSRKSELLGYVAHDIK